MTEKDTLALYEKTGALLRGHFRLTSGLHSDIYLQSALVLQHPEHAEALGAALADAFRDAGARTVLAPAIGGILVAHEVARALGLRALFTEREQNVMTLRRGFTLERGEPCLVVEDVITTGGSTRETIAAAETSGAAVLGAAAIIDRGADPGRLNIPLQALVRMDVPAYAPEACPMCAKGTPVTKPGSRA